MERAIGTACLTAEYDTEKTRIASLSNTYLEQINNFVRQLNNIKDGKDLDADMPKNEAEEENEEE